MSAADPPPADADRIIAMIDKNEVLKAVETAIEGTDLFVVDVEVSPAKSIIVEVDSDTCTSLTRKIEELLPAELEDYDLEVGSAGLTSPFRVRGQWEKNVGNEIELLTADGRKLTGVLASLGEDDFTLEYQVKEKLPGKKRPEMVTKSERIPLENVKKASYLLRFK